MTTPRRTPRPEVTSTPMSGMSGMRPSGAAGESEGVAVEAAGSSALDARQAQLHERRKARAEISTPPKSETGAHSRAPAPRFEEGEAPRSAVNLSLGPVISSSMRESGITPRALKLRKNSPNEKGCPAASR